MMVNPVHLAELTPSDYAKKLVEYFGDTDAVLEKAKEDFAKGEYQWVAQITNTLVFADPENTDARYLCADALEQLGYQAESGPWRSAYLCAAQELRNGTNTDDATRSNGNGDVVLTYDTGYDSGLSGNSCRYDEGFGSDLYGKSYIAGRQLCTPREKWRTSLSEGYHRMRMQM